ncbi:hypothetical protein OROGR_014721 [Orobanche gracilis]
MGNCSLRAATDAPREDALRTTSRKASVVVLPPPRNGIWKVRLMIDPKNLEMILSEEVNTEALIERMRFAAKSTPIKGKSHWGEAGSYKCACLSDRVVQPSRGHIR